MLQRLLNRLGQAVGWLTLAVVITTFVIVVLRRVFSLGWIGLQESVVYMHATVFMLGIAWTLAQDGHVRVDIFYRGAGERRRAIIDSLGLILFVLPLCGFILYTSWDYVLASWKLLEGSREAGGLPLVYLLKTLILLLAVTLFLQAALLLPQKLRQAFPQTG